MVYSAAYSIPVGSVIMADNSTWLRPHDVEQLLGVKWTRPRRTRILNAMKDAGVIVERPVIGSTLIDRASLLAYLDDLKSGRIAAPDWYNEIQTKI